MIVKNATFGNIQNNCYLVVDEKTNCSALVDCTECSQKMLDFIGETDLKYIFLTHGHFDHITGVKGVKEKYGARVVISHEDAPMLSSAKLSLAAFCGGEQNIVEPDILVVDGDVVKLNDTESCRRQIADMAHRSNDIVAAAEIALNVFSLCR